MYREALICQVPQIMISIIMIYRLDLIENALSVFFFYCANMNNEKLDIYTTWSGPLGEEYKKDIDLKKYSP